MRRLFRPLVVRMLRRDEDEVAVRARSFRIERADGLELVARLGRAFLGGYNAMLAEDRTERVCAAGLEVAAHYRPFWFEGVAMGYLARGLWDPDCRPANAERDLLRMRPEFLYLYYVGLGFWYGFRHPRRPEQIARLADAIDPLYFPLCYDGFGFKLGFFDGPRDASVARRLARCPEPFTAQAYQGFGRSMFFVTMDDEAGWHALRETLPAERGADLELGRALARGFTGVNRPDALVAYIESARNTDDRASRLTGITWALTARKMNDAAYYAECLGGASARSRALLEPLPEICDRLRVDASSYGAWQAATRDAVVASTAA